jgi:hypothetical protein
VNKKIIFTYSIITSLNPQTVQCTYRLPWIWSKQRYESLPLEEIAATLSLWMSLFVPPPQQTSLCLNITTWKSKHVKARKVFSPINAYLSNTAASMSRSWFTDNEFVPLGRHIDFEHEQRQCIPSPCSVKVMADFL